MKKNNSLLLSTPYIIWMVIFTLIPLGVVGYYALTDPATGVFTLANIRSLNMYWGVLWQSIAYSLVSALICLTVIDTLPLWLVLLYFSKELAQAVCSYILMRRTKDMIASNILGKAGTTLFYITIVTLTLFDPPAALQNTLLLLSYVTIVAAFVSYLLQGFRQQQLHHPTSEE